LSAKNKSAPEDTMASTATRKPKVDVYDAVTTKILTALENGTAPWQQPWDSVTGAPKSLSTGKAYRGINAFLLGLEQAEKGYRSAYWLTFNQMAKLGGKLKGEKGTQKGTLVTFWKMFRVEDEATGKKKMIPFLKHFYVFNLDQTEGIEKLPKDAFPVARPVPSPEERHAAAQAVVDAWDAKPVIEHGGDSAHFNWATDVLTMPPVESFHGLDEYFATKFHELTHSTGAEHRLDRAESRGNAFGSHAYGREELIAEMGAAFLCAETGIQATFANSAAYLASWIKTIKEDPRAVIVAAGKAQKAADMILGREQAKTEETDEQATTAA
jgi:antirestriction protein ArdC